MLRFIFIFLIFSSSVLASEVDSFTGTERYLGDATSSLNQLTNKWIDEASNSLKLGCSEEKLVQAIAEKFNTFGWSKFEREISGSNTIDKINPIAKNIYQDFSEQGAGAGVLKFLSPLFKVQEHYVGADKFSHFFNEGFQYFKKVLWKGEPLDSAFVYGESMENGLWGKLTMGIYSYADLAANYSGYLFFKNLTQGERPYFKCENQNWNRVRNFRFNDYIDASWDERINCNSFRTKKLKALFTARLAQIERAHNRAYSCPVSRSQCDQLILKYQEHAEHLISPSCH